MASLDPAQFGLAPLEAPHATAPAQPAHSTPDPNYPRAPVTVAPTGPSGTPSGTNLSPDQQSAFDAQVAADRAKNSTVALPGQSPSPGAVEVSTPSPTTTPPSKSLDAAQFGLGPAAEQSVPAAAPQKQGPDLSNIPQTFAGSLAATLAAIPRGLVGGTVDDYLNAAGMTPLNMILGKEGPSEAFHQSLREIQAQNHKLAGAYPQANVAGELTGALAGGAALSPVLGWERGAAFLPSAGSYVARNAATGGLLSAMNGGSPTTGALIGGALPALHVAGSAVSTPLASLYQRLAPLWSSAAREASVGNKLGGLMNGARPQTSPVGPLDLAQATNNPEIAARVDLAPSFNAPANSAVREAQQQAVANQIGKIGAPATSADASATGVNAIRDLSAMTRERERELWTNPALTDYLFQTTGLKQAAQAALNAVQKDDPGLMLGMTGDMRGALAGLMKTPERANLANINSFIGVLKSIARRPPPDNARAGALAARLLGSIENARDATISSSGAPSVVQSAYQAARDFTRERAGIMGTQDMRAMTAKNPTGAYVADPSEGLRRFFNFSNGSLEGAQNLHQLIEFADKVKADWLGRGSAQLIGEARDALRDSARSYVAASLVKASRVGEGQNFNPKLMQDFLRTNRGWMRDSGLFNAQQIDATSQLMDYVAMLRRPEQLLRQVNSATQARQARAANFIDQIMSPWARRLAEIGGTVMGGHHGGLVGAGAGVAGSAAFEHAVGHAETTMREMMAEALLNPRVAQDLMMKASAANRAMLSPETRQLLDTLRVAVGTEMLPRLAAPAPATAQ